MLPACLKCFCCPVNIQFCEIKLLTHKFYYNKFANENDVLFQDSLSLLSSTVQRKKQMVWQSFYQDNLIYLFVLFGKLKIENPFNLVNFL